MKNIQKISAICLAVLYLFSFSFIFADKSLNDNKVKTTIAGIESVINANSSEVLERKIEISPSNTSRVVLLQLYNSALNKYETISKYNTDEVQSAEVVVSFPKEYRLKTLGKWRIEVLENKTCKKAEATINIISNNIETKEIDAKGACVYCVEDNAVIYEKHCHKRLKPASTTKVMTATLLIENDKLHESVKISKKAANTEYSNPEMKAGDSYKNIDLLYAMMLPSSNGAAVAAAESVSGLTSDFTKLMNSKVEKLGLKDSHFVNPHGLDADNHYSSAFDIAYITGNIYKESQVFRTVISNDIYFITSEKSPTVTIKSKDKLRAFAPKHKGGKTGRTTGAGYCFSGVYVHEGKTYVACVLGAKTGKNRWKDMKTLYKYIDKYAATEY